MQSSTAGLRTDLVSGFLLVKGVWELGTFFSPLVSSILSSFPSALTVIRKNGSGVHVCVTGGRRWQGGEVVWRGCCVRGGEGCTDKASCLLNLLSRLFSSRRWPHADDGAKRMPPVENLTQHGVMATATPDKH